MNNLDSPKNNINDDKLGYSQLAFYFAKIIKEIKPINNAYVIGLCGKWGNGKTTLINFVKQILAYAYNNNCDLDFKNYRNIINNIKNTDIINLPVDKTLINKTALFGSTISLMLAIITLFIKFDLIIKLKVVLKNLVPLDYYLIFVLFLFIFSIPKIRDLLIALIKQIFQRLSTLFLIQHDIPEGNLVIIDFNPWHYQKDENIIKNFFKVIGQKIKIKDDNKKINLLVKYASCLMNIKLPEICDCDDYDINELKTDISNALREGNKKYLIIIDDLDRIQTNEISAVLKAVKLLADFPNVIYFLAYDKEYLSNQYNAQNSNYMQKIVQLEKDMPIISEAKLKEIFIDRITNIANKVNTDLNKNDLAKIYDLIITKVIKNIRDINRFENSFYSACIIHQNIWEMDLIDYILISLLEEFDKESYKLIRENKQLLFENISSIELKKHTEFIQTLSKKPGFQVFIALFANYLNFVKEALVSLIADKTSAIKNNSDISQSNASNCLDLFKFQYMQFYKEDTYRHICKENSFDNYFLSNIAVSLVTDVEYQSLINSINNSHEFKVNFSNIFSKNQDKFKDFYERLIRDNNVIGKKDVIENLVIGILNLDDTLLTRLFNIRNFCKNILSIIKERKLITKQEFLKILLNTFGDTNIIQQIYWYYELQLSNIDEYFKIEKFKPFSLNELKEKISLSDIKNLDNDANLYITILTLLRNCNLKPSNFENLTRYILEDEHMTLELLQQCNNIKDCYFYFEFSDIQNLLIKNYFETKNIYLGNTNFRDKIVTPVLNEKLQHNKTSFSLGLNQLINNSTNLASAIRQIKTAKNIRQEQKKYLNDTTKTFIKNNIFEICNNISDNELIIKYVLHCCLNDANIANRLDSVIKTSIDNVEQLKELDIEINVDKLIQSKDKYENIVNELWQYQDNNI